MKILVVDDDQDICELISKMVYPRAADIAYSLDEAKKKIDENFYDIIICDLVFPKGTGVDLLKYKNEVSLDSIFVLLTGYGSGKVAIEALQLGAFDYITKPFKNIELTMCIDKAAESRKALIEQEALKKVISVQKNEGFIYKSKKIDEIVSLAEKVARSEVDIILIEGPTGVGKEVLAKFIHNNSKRNENPFIEINCAALPENLLESELFGHEKGAFTDAKESKRGLFEIASGGTVFLDEIGELASSLQVKLLRVVEDKSFMRVGGLRKITTDVRIIAATNKSLDEEVKNQNFRNDLYYRLKVISFYLPPLIDRKEDIKALLEYYMQYYSKFFHKNVEKISSEAMEVFMEYNWPGNIRELKNVIERIVLLEEENTIALRHIPVEMMTLPEILEKTSLFSGNKELDKRSIEPLEEVENRHIRHVLSAFNNNKTQTAQALGISRKTLWDKIRKYELKVK
ncbi:MAG: sigma-54 dependent transcriptional regulator [Spirochaetes bacterium]|nr:sigma-54 dependent transcriptional regulator [Spirochaetota bacterium]